MRENWNSLSISLELYWKNQYFPSDVNPNSSTNCGTVQNGIFSGKIGINRSQNGAQVSGSVVVHGILQRITVQGGGSGESCQ